MGEATGQAAAWPTSCCPPDRARPLGPGTGQPPGTPGQGQERVEKGQGVRWGQDRPGARGMPELRVRGVLCCAPVPGAQGSDHAPPPQDFLRCVTAALIYFAISITAVAKYSDAASKAAGVSSPPSPGRGCPAMPPQGHPTPGGAPDALWTLSVWGRVCPRIGPWTCTQVSTTAESLSRASVGPGLGGCLPTKATVQFPTCRSWEAAVLVRPACSAGQVGRRLPCLSRALGPETPSSP